MVQFFAAVPVVLAADAINNTQANVSSQLTNTSSNSTGMSDTEILAFVLGLVGGSAVIFFTALALVLRKMSKDDPDEMADEAPSRRSCPRQ